MHLLPMRDDHIMGFVLSAWAAAGTFQDMLAVSRSPLCALFTPAVHYRRSKLLIASCRLINLVIGRGVTLSCKCFVSRGTTQRKEFCPLLQCALTPPGWWGCLQNKFLMALLAYRLKKTHQGWGGNAANMFNVHITCFWLLIKCQASSKP